MCTCNRKGGNVTSGSKATSLTVETFHSSKVIIIDRYCLRVEHYDLYLNKLNPLHPRMLCVNGQWFWCMKKIFYVVNVFLPFSPLGKGLSSSFEQFEYSSLKYAFCEIYMKLVYWFCTRCKCEKFTDRLMKDTGNQKSSLELSAQESWKQIICLPSVWIDPLSIRWKSCTIFYELNNNLKSALLLVVDTRFTNALCTTNLLDHTSLWKGPCQKH